MSNDAASQPPIVTRDDDGTFLLDFPWGSAGRVEVGLSAADARAVAHAILDADSTDLKAGGLE